MAAEFVPEGGVELGGVIGEHGRRQERGEVDQHNARQPPGLSQV